MSVFNEKAELCRLVATLSARVGRWFCCQVLGLTKQLSRDVKVSLWQISSFCFDLNQKVGQVIFTLWPGTSFQLPVVSKGRPKSSKGTYFSNQFFILQR